jgi:hypothetical protein
MRKNYKIIKHPNKIHILKEIHKKINILKLSSNKKNDRFAYLKWRIFNKIWVSVVVIGFIMGGWIVFRLEGGVTVCCRKKKHKKEGEMGEGKGEMRVDRHIIN